ncbi:hypothetical protein B0H10DRAFT_1958024 [Mycena sp. CBHHK59/15]|nr:hypothetical protein B0H10DRAFT_1958024 [Mycena sp. CBHHK59/15]
MPKGSTPCTSCPLSGGRTHYVPKCELTEHKLALARFREAQPPVTAGLSLGDDADPASPLVDEQLADLITGLSLTDDGPNVRQQPSKLFSTRDDFQELRSSQIPSSFHPIPLSEATSSIQSLLGSHAHPKIASVPRDEDVLNGIRSQVEIAQKNLSLVEGLYEDNYDLISLSMALDTASEIVISAGKLLRSVTTSKSPDFLALKKEVLSEVQVLDRHIDVIGAYMPKSKETGPVL